MTRITLFSALLLSACAAPDWCYTHRAEVETCIELRRADPSVECQCQTRASGKMTPTADKPDRPKPEDPDEPDGEEPGPHDHSEDGDDGGVPHDADDPRYHPRDLVVVRDEWPSRGRW